MSVLQHPAVKIDQYINQKTREGKVFWRVDELEASCRHLGATDAALPRILQMLIDDRVLRRIQQGKYISGAADPISLARFVNPASVVTGPYVLFAAGLTVDTTYGRVDAMVTTTRPRIIQFDNYSYYFHRVMPQILCGFNMETRVASVTKAVLDSIYLSKAVGRRSAGGWRCEFDVRSFLEDAPDETGLRQMLCGTIRDFVDIYPSFVGKACHAAGLEWAGRSHSISRSR